jgi:hypothetical protein
MGLTGWIIQDRLYRMERKKLFVALLFLLFVFYGCLDLGTISRQFLLSGGILYRGLPSTKGELLGLVLIEKVILGNKRCFITMDTLRALWEQMEKN